MRILFFGLISLAGMAFCGFSLYSQAYGSSGFPLPPPFSPPLPVDALWGGMGLAMIIGSYAASGRLSFRGFYWSCALAIMGFLLTYTFSFAPYSVVLSPDSLEYLMLVTNGSFPIACTTGYPLFLFGVHKMVGLHFLPPIQLFCELVAYFLGGYLLLTRLHIWRLFSILIFAFPFFFPGFMSYSFSVLTEALFLAGLTLGGAALAAAVKSLRIMDFLLSGIGLAVAVAVKSIGVALVLPLFLSLRFIPWGSWWKACIFAILPMLSVYGAMCFAHYRKTGHFSAETFGGLSLLAHVGGFLDGNIPKPPGLSQEVKKAVKTITDKRPKNLYPIHSIEALDQYIMITRNEYNTLIYEAIQPTVQKKISNPIERDTFYSRLALTTIMHHPFLYLGHAGAHFYGMWSHVGQPVDFYMASLPVDFRSKDPLGSGFSSARASEAKRIGEILAGNMSTSSQQGAAQRQSHIPVLFKYIPSESWWPIARSIGVEFLFFSLGFISLLLVFVYIFSRKWAHIYASPVVLSLVINVYFFAYALFQPFEPRYVWVATPLVFFLFLALLIALFRSGSSQTSLASVDRVKQFGRKN